MIEGLDILPDFVTELEERNLVGAIESEPNRTQRPRDGRSRLERYGAIIYRDHIASIRIPTFLDGMVTKLELLGIGAFNSVTVNGYDVGWGLGLHFDKPECGENICVLGLLGDAQMIFELLRGKGQTVAFPRRALMWMRGPARHEWQHEVLPVKKRRISIVFRQAVAK